MSLALWLPLQSNLNNQGLADATVYKAANLTYAAGNMGKCLQFKGNANQILSFKNVPQKANNFTWACWIKQTNRTSTTYNNINQFILSMGRNCGAVGFNVLINNGTLQIKLGSGTSQTTSDTSTKTAKTVAIAELTLNTWYHVCTAVDDKKVYVYINDSLKTSFDLIDINYYLDTGKDSVIDTCSYFTIGKMAYGHTGTSTYFPFDGYIGDVRVYDTCLSPREIKEISKGLCLHYPLNDPYPTASLNKYSGEYFNGKAMDINTFTITKLDDERGYNYKLSYTGTGNARYFPIAFPYYSFNVNKTYDYSCKIRFHKRSNVTWTLRASRSNNDWVTNMIRVDTVDDQWHEYHIRQTIPTSYDRSGTTVTSKPQLEFYTNNCNTKDTVYELDFDLKDVQVSECTTDAPTSNGTWIDNAVYDASGFGNHGKTVSGSAPAVSSDSPRNSCCYEFGNKQYVLGKSPFGTDNVSTLTINFWVNQTSGGGYSTVCSLNGYSGVTNGLWLCINTEGVGQWAYIRDNSPVYSKQGSLISKNTWNMYTFIFNNGEASFYLNGKKNGSTVTYTNKYITSVNDLIIGDNYAGTNWNTTFNGKISDFRIYGTALSDTDIMELYNTPVTLTNTGTLMTQGEFVEK